MWFEILFYSGPHRVTQEETTSETMVFTDSRAKGRFRVLGFRVLGLGFRV